MTARSAVHVHVVSKDGTKRAWLAPGDEVPAWARLDKRNLQTDGGGATSAPAEPASGQPPARSGPGSGKEAWAVFAAARQVEVPEGSSRDDIIAACEAAGIVEEV